MVAAAIFLGATAPPSRASGGSFALSIVGELAKPEAKQGGNTGLG